MLLWPRWIRQFHQDQQQQLGRFLQLGALFWQNCSLHWAYLQANAAVDAGGKINPVPVGSFLVFAGAFMDAGDRASANAIGNPFTDVSNNSVWHGKFR